MVVVPTPRSFAAVVTETANGFGDRPEEPPTKSFVNARLLQLGARAPSSMGALNDDFACRNLFRAVIVGIRISDNFQQHSFPSRVYSLAVSLVRRGQSHALGLFKLI
jgi:hypothetical protein